MRSYTFVLFGELMFDLRTGIRRACAAVLCVCLVLFLSFSASGRTVGDTWRKRSDELFTTSELLDSSVTDLVTALEEGRITSVQLVQMYLDRIEAYDSELELNSFITVNPDVLSEAQAADEARASGEGGRLLGIPVVIKDKIEVKGLPTTNGLSSNLGRIASEDAWIVSRLKAEGAVIIGKSNLSQESASGQTTRSSAGGRTHNAYDLSRTPAGSSGGSAVAVACNFAAFGIGTDTASSVRRPASFAGLYGVRPSYGLVSRNGTIIVNDDYDTPGILAKTAEDAALVLDIISGTDPSDSITSSADSLIPEEGYYEAAIQGRAFEGLRIGFLANSFGYYYESSTGDELRRPTELSSVIRGMVDRTLAVFTDNGAELVDISGYMSEDYITRVRDGGVAFFRRAIDDILEDLEIDAVVYVSQTDVPEIESTASWRSDNQSYYINVFSPVVGLPEIMIPMGLSDTDPSNGVYNAMALGLSMFTQYGKDADLLAIAAEYGRLSDSRTLPQTVPALPDRALADLAAEAVKRAENILESFRLSEESLNKISSALEAVKAVSMDGAEETVKVPVAEFHNVLNDLCLELDNVEIMTGNVPVRSIETIRFFVQRYRRAISVSSVSVLLFSFAMLLTRGGKKQRKTYLEIPQIIPGSDRNEPASQRMRSALDAVREQRRLLREARKNAKSLKDADVQEIARRAEDLRSAGNIVPGRAADETSREGVSSRIEASGGIGRKKKLLISELRTASRQNAEEKALRRKEAKEAAELAAAERRAAKEAERLRKKEAEEARRLALKEQAAEQKALKEAARLEEKAQEEARRHISEERAAERKAAKEAARIDARAERARTQAKKKASREKAAALRTEAKLARREANAQKRRDVLNGLKASFAAFILKLKETVTEWLEHRRSEKEAAAEQRKLDIAAEALQRKQKRETAIREAAIKEEERKQEELRREEEKAQKKSQKEALKAAQREAKELEKAREQERKVIAQKERAYVIQEKKKARAEKRAASLASIAAFFNGIGDLIALRNADWVARKEQKQIDKAAKEQLRAAEQLRKKQESEERRRVARAAKMQLSEEQRRLKEEKEIERTAAAEFKRLQRKQKRELFFSSIKDYFKTAAETRRKNREDRRIRRAEELFIRNTEIRDKKRQIEELKAERARIAQENAVREAAEKEKKVLAETARKEAEAAYRAMIDDRISQQIEYLEKQSAQRREAELERKRQKEARLQERAAQRQAQEERRREEKLRLAQEKEAMRQARQKAEEERKAREEQIRAEKRAQAAKLSFEKNKDKIIIAQRKEVEKLRRQEKRRTAHEEAVQRRTERRIIRRKKISLFFQDLPTLIRGIPVRIKNAVKAAAASYSAWSESVQQKRKEEAERRIQAKAEKAVRLSNAKAEKERFRKEKEAAAESAKHEKAEAKAVSNRLKKQQQAERKAKAEKEKQRQHDERTAKKTAAALVRAERRKKVSAAFSSVFASVSAWIKSIFSTTENWIKRIAMMIAGIFMFIFRIPKRVLEAVLKIPQAISAVNANAAQKRALRAEQRVFKNEQRRIAGEKQKAVGVMKTGSASSAVNTAADTQTVIVNMENEAPFWFTQKNIRDFIKPYRTSTAVIALTYIFQALCFAYSLSLITEGIGAVSDLTIDSSKISLLIKTAVFIISGLIANALGRGALSSVQKNIAREMRRVEFSLRRENDQSLSMTDDIMMMQELISTKSALVFDITLLASSIIALCVSNPFNAIVLIVSVLINSALRKKENRKLSECKSIEEAVTLREAVAADWARKLRVNKLLGRGNDSYENVRNATLEVNIRKLSVRDVTTDSSIAVRTVLYSVMIVICAVTCLVQFGVLSVLKEWLYPGIQIFVIVPSMVNAVRRQLDKLKDRRMLSASVEQKLNTADKSGGESDGT